LDPESWQCAAIALASALHSAVSEPMISSDTPHRIAIVVQRTATHPDATAAAGPVGRWLAEDIRGGGVIDRVQTVLEIAADGAISGTGGCNTMRGTATIAGDTIAIGAIASTRMACPRAVMEQESKFFAALRSARTWRIDSARRKLALLDADGKPVVVFARM
jgi:heat shock protein HslJ